MLVDNWLVMHDFAFGDDIVVVNRKTFTIAGSIKVPGMIGGGHHIAVDSKGNIYIAQTTMGLQKLKRRS